MPLGDRVGVLTFAQRWKNPDAASSRIRGRWLVKYWQHAELFTIGRRYDTVIFQKVYWVEYARLFPGVKILDICDPDFLHWNPTPTEMMECCDAITTSTEALKRFLSPYTRAPVFVIPDRMDLETVQGLQKQHRGSGPTKTVAWYGYSHNFAALDALAPRLRDLGIETLMVISDRDKPYQPAAGSCDGVRIVNYAWELDTVNQHLLEADVVLNPQPPLGRWIYKSNNKTVNAWALGLPVAHTLDELSGLLTDDARVREAESRMAEVRDRYNVRQSVSEYEAVIREIRGTKHGGTHGALRQ